jgi:DNA repair protein RecO
MKHKKNYLKTDAIVLNRYTHGEADKLAVLFTMEFGKIKAVAPGARKIHARFIMLTEPMVRARYMVYGTVTDNSYVKIVGAELQTVHPELRCDHVKYQYACKVLETTDLLTVEHNRNDREYNLLQRTLELLCTASNPCLIYCAFVLRFLKYAGFGLDFNQKEIYNNILYKLATLSGNDVDKLVLTDEVKQEVETSCTNLLYKHVRKPLKSARNAHRVI